MARIGHDPSGYACAHRNPSNIGVSSRLFFKETLTRTAPNDNQLKIGFDWYGMKIR